MRWVRSCWTVLAVGLLASSVLAQTPVDLSDTQLDPFTAHLTTWKPFTLGCESYRSTDIADNHYNRVVAAPFYKTGSGLGVPWIEATYSVVNGVFTVNLSGGNLKPNFAYQVKLIGKPEAKWTGIAPCSDWANEQIGGGRWWCTVIDKNGAIVDAYNSNDREYAKWKNKGFYDRGLKLTYWFEGYLLFDFVLTDASGNVAPVTLEANKSYHVLWQCGHNQDGTIKQEPWNQYQGTPAANLMDWNNLKTTTVDVTNSNWYSDGSGGAWGVVPEIEDTVYTMADGDYPAFLAVTEESFHANLPPQYGPNYHDPDYGGCWMSAMCAHVNFHLATPPQLTSVTVAPTSATVLVGAQQQFTATAAYSDGSQQDVTGQAPWTSGNLGVASVSAGLATGVAAGSTSLTASFGGFSDSATLTVTAPGTEVMTILRANYDGRFLQVEATSSQAPNVTLKVTTDTGISAAMVYAGGQLYTYKKKLKSSQLPGTVTVTSTGGSTDSVSFPYP